MKYPSIKKWINSNIYLRIDYYNMAERNELEKETKKRNELEYI